MINERFSSVKVAGAGFDNHGEPVASAVVPNGYNGGEIPVRLVLTVDGELREVWEHGSFRAAGVSGRFSNAEDALQAVWVSSRYRDVTPV